MKDKKEGSLTKCNNPKLAEKLTSFIDGTLSREEMEEFDKHLLECDKCKDMFFFALDLDELIKKIKPSSLLKTLKE